MTEFERTPEGKIKVPQFEAGRQQRAERKAVIDKVKAELEAEQKRAAHAEPFAPFKYRLPLEVLAGGQFSEEELRELHTHEEISYDKHRPLAASKDAQRRSWVAAGGDAETFERDWYMAGEDADIAERAERIRKEMNHTSIY